MSDAEIERTAPPELRELPDDFWDAASLMPPVAKSPIYIRIDDDVLAWFRAQGPRYQTRINAVLKAYVSARRGRARR